MSGNINFNGWLNDDGSENYKCRAWVNFNGTGTVAIRASGNVSSITDNGTGNYTVNFTTAMPDTGFSSLITGDGATSVSYMNPISSTSIYVFCIDYGSSLRDPIVCNVAIFR